MPVPVGSSTRSPSSPTTVAVNGARSGAATLSLAISRETLCAGDAGKRDVDERRPLRQAAGRAREGDAAAEDVVNAPISVV